MHTSPITHDPPLTHNTRCTPQETRCKREDTAWAPQMKWAKSVGELEGAMEGDGLWLTVRRAGAPTRQYGYI